MIRLLDRGLELRFDGVWLGLSARRIWEHTALRQTNPFRPITPKTRIRAEDYVDVIDAAAMFTSLTGVTLADLVAGKHQRLIRKDAEQLLQHLDDAVAKSWLQSVRQILLKFRQQRSVRNLPAPFLPRDDNSPFGIPGLHCALRNWLNDHRSEKAKAEQWSQRIKNLKKKGLRTEEFKISNVDRILSLYRGKSIDGEQIFELLGYMDLQFSILPVLQYSGRHLQFSSVSGGATIKRIKPKLKRKLQMRPQWRDPVMGYWIDVIDWDDLLGHQRGWMAFTVRGEPVTSDANPLGLCESPEEAMTLADSHASKVLPKMSTRGKWPGFRLTGGEQYREWLVTLPHHRPTFLSGHFEHRNILFHVRCDIREGDDGERVLVLQEVQSDWAKSARAASRRGSRTYGTVPPPPWLKEWPALALKLMLLHAAQSGVAALAWTPGSIQVDRWEGLGEKGLIDLYDRRLPRELNRLLRPYEKQCGNIDVFQPVNFSIEPADSGYIVRDENDEYLGTAQSWPDVQRLLPDGAHEVLTAMHGVRLDEAMRARVLSEGFYAWGQGFAKS